MTVLSGTELPVLSPGQAGIADLHDAGLWDQVIEEIDGRRIRIGRSWLTDFASCN